jgi:hypothetical protein
MNFNLLNRFILIGFIFCCSIKISAQENPIVFKNVNVISMEDATVQKNKNVFIQNGKILSIDNRKIPKGTQVIDGTGKYLMPGLAEMHAHVPPVDDIEPMKDVLELFALNGITTIRGMLGHPRHLELREMIRKGEILSPSFYTSGPSFSGNSVTTAEQAEAMVRNQKKAGYDFLKLHPGLTPEVFRSIVKTAQEEKIPYGGHVSFQVGLKAACESNYATIDHLDGMVEALVPNINNYSEEQTGLFGMFIGDKADESRIPQVIKMIKENHVWLVPTQSLAERWFAPDATPEKMNAEPEMKYMNAATRNTWMQAKSNLMADSRYNAEKMNQYIALRQRLILEAHKNGIGLLLGSDGPQIFNVPGFSVHHELRYLVACGLTPFEALQTGTVRVAEFYKSTNSGKIKSGYVADLILLGSNPLDDITNSTNIQGVVVRGKWIDKNSIETRLKHLEKN